MAHQDGAAVVSHSGRLKRGYLIVLAWEMCWSGRLGGGRGGAMPAAKFSMMRLVIGTNARMVSRQAPTGNQFRANVWTLTGH
jgi:hypothetical protein